MQFFFLIPRDGGYIVRVSLPRDVSTALNMTEKNVSFRAKPVNLVETYSSSSPRRGGYCSCFASARCFDALRLLNMTEKNVSFRAFYSLSFRA